ncbi:MAG: hypothetical protein ABF310_01425 [Paracoccaceae bacterium]|mgnify:CR=1 FL=1|jgi:hypothetical protein
MAKRAADFVVLLEESPIVEWMGAACLCAGFVGILFSSLIL